MSRLWQTILSIWAWLVFVACVVLWFPVLAVVRLLTAPFDPGRYIPGRIFRKIGPAMATLNPLWRFRYSGTMPKDPEDRSSWSPITSRSPTSSSSAICPGK